MNRHSRARNEISAWFQDLWWAPMIWPYGVFFVAFGMADNWHWSLRTLLFTACMPILFLSLLVMIPVQALFFAGILATAVVTAPAVVLRALIRRFGVEP